MAGRLDGAGGRRIRRPDYPVHDARQYYCLCSCRRVEQRFPRNVVRKRSRCRRRRFPRRFPQNAPDSHSLYFGANLRPRCLTHAIMYRHGRRSMGGKENGI